MTPDTPTGFSRRSFLRGAGVGLAGTAFALALPDAAWSTAGPAHVRIPLDTGWRFGPLPESADATALDFADTAFEEVTLPHSTARLSWRDVRPRDFPGEYAGGAAPYEGVWIYRREFDLPSGADGARVFVDFGASMASSTVHLNGQRLGTYAGGYTPFTFELTDGLRPGRNLLVVRVDSRRTQTGIPPFGGSFGNDPTLVRVDFDTFGGLHRSVSLRVVPQTFIENVFAKPLDVLTDGRRLEVDCHLEGTAALTQVASVEVELRDGSRLVRRGTAQVANGIPLAQVSLTELSDVELWDVDNPKLYTLSVVLREGPDGSGRPLHEYSTRVGIRETQFTPNGFYLNGKHLKIRGINRHEIYPYVGNAMPDRVKARDAHIIRHELNCTMVRTSHYPHSDAFLDACDEVGLLVWDEMPGWGFVGGQAWQDVATENVEKMIRRDWNHPSVVLWAVRVNESNASFAAFETQLNDLAHRLDPTRQTSGAYSGTQTLRQDVRGQNDYADDEWHPLTPPRPGRYIISEAVGQKRPGGDFTQTYTRTDAVAAQQAQARRHALVHSAATADDRYAGVLAWCAFEYLSPRNSVRDIKTPGVCDIFRVPKLGASFYQAQLPPSERVVVQPAFYWDFGPASPTGPGRDALIFSNCDRLDLELDGRPYAWLTPDHTRFAGLDHPPFPVDLLFEGDRRPVELTIKGYVGDRLVTSRTMSADPSGDRLAVTVDDAAIRADGIDATRVVFRAVDGDGFPRPFVTGRVQIDTAGPVDVVGDRDFDFEGAGGVGAVWVRSAGRRAGRAVITASHPTLGGQTVTVQLTQPGPNANALV
ncbi:glycoside hydrolase family 2 TIM barrel-domain containing protein [Intrasporangium mesophilum]